MGVAFVVPIILIFVIGAIIGYTVSKRTKEQQKQMTRRTSGKPKYRDPVITCDYCGGKIDTHKETACPNCGATFALDNEWLERYKTAAPEPAADGQNLEKKKRIAIIIMIVAAVAIAAVAFTLAGNVARIDRDFRRNEKPNENSYDAYVRADYAVAGDGTIIDDSGVTVTVTGFYTEESPYGDPNVRVEYQVENRSGSDVCIGFELVGVNGSTSEGSLGFTYDWFRKNASVTIYETLYGVPGGRIGELIYRNRDLYDGEGYLMDDDTFIRVETGAAPEIPVGKPIYEGNGVTVLDLGRDGERLQVCIVNDTDTDYSFRTTDLRINGKAVDTAGFYKESLPARYVFTQGGLFGYGGDWDAVSDGDVVDVSFSFTSAAEPEKDFSTGYLRLGDN